VIKRQLFKELQTRLFSGKVILLTGPRQVGKTTILQELLRDRSDVESLVLDADDPTTRDLLNQPNSEQIREILGKAKLIVIDEAQRINGIGLTAKIIVDQMKDRQLILSGSSSFDLTGALQEPLTGRKWTYHLYPISWAEYQEEVGYVQAEQALETRLIYGMYPDVLTHPEDQEQLLKELVDSYLLKDVFAYSGLRKPDTIYQLVRALAFQVGQEVNLSELANLLKIDAKTVGHYIDVLEQAFVVFRLPSFSRNLRNEIKRNRKIYFHDNGVRNMVIGQVQPVSMRDDIGA
jgi:predicted AAA+ superfamily ATPase